MLDDVELEQVQVVETDDDHVVVRHDVPALETAFLQRLGRRAERIDLSGVLTAPVTGESLATLRGRFLAGRPVPFVSDITSATGVGQVLIEEMHVRDVAGNPDRFEYRFLLREFVPGRPVTTTTIEIPPPPPPPVLDATLSVTVIVEGEPTFDFDRVVVSASGTRSDGQALQRVLTNRVTPNVWEESPFPPGSYTVTATVPGEPELTGSAAAEVREGETAAVTIVLRRGTPTARRLVVTFRFDSAFVEPCQREVLHQMTRLLGSSPDDRLVLVGHTDLVGPPEYNQSLSERRGRSVFAMATAGNDGASEDRAVAEWDELRRARPAGTTRTVRDSWGTREVQQMLQDLGFYNGPIGGDPQGTDAAVRRFQAEHGLVADGDVGDDTWPVLIRAYLRNGAVRVDPGRLLPNADGAGCDEGPLRWLGCGEHTPHLNTPLAERRNRRTELLMVRATELPCRVPPPVTLDLNPAGAGGGGWCLGPGGGNRCCFVGPEDDCQPTPGGPWCRVPADPRTFEVRGRLRFDDGTPAAGVAYVLTAADGEYMDGEQPATNGAVRAGTPFPGRSGPDGELTRNGAPYGPRRAGVWTIEVDGPFVARLEGAPVSAARGPVVCAFLDGSRDLVVVLTGRDVVGIVPTVTGPAVLVVPRPHTSPARQPLVLRVAPAFTGTGTLTRDSDRVRVFTAAAGGTELAFDGTDNTFPADRLVAGVTVFLEARRVSDAVDDTTLTLALTVGGRRGLAATHTLTCALLTLDAGLSRTAAGAPPPAMSEADKVNVGRPVQVQTPTLEAERAILVVRPPQPAGLAVDLSLTRLGARTLTFPVEAPAPGQAPEAEPRVIASSTIPAGGLEVFVEGTDASAAARDAGYQLGLAGGEPAADRVAMTVVSVEVADTAAPAAPAATRIRPGLWDNAFDATTGALRNAEAAAGSFVDLDTRRLHLRVRDASRAGTLEAAWTTRTASGAPDPNDARTGAAADITLTADAAAPATFVSRGLLIVTDTEDRDEPVNSGLPPGHPDRGNRTRGQRNHRTRMITVDAAHPLDSLSRVEYTAMAGVNPFRLTLPVFGRNPDERRRMRAHFVNVRRSVGGTPVMGAAELQRHRDALLSVYARAGVFAEIDELLLDPPPSTTVWVALHPGDPLAVNPSVETFAFAGGNLTPSTSMADIITAVRARPGFDANDLNVVMVAQIYERQAVPGPLVNLSNGESFPDSFTAAGATSRGFVVVGLQTQANRLTTGHEVTHVTTDLRNAAGGHFYLGANVQPRQNGPIDTKNLMFPVGSPDTNGVLNRKRLWDTAFVNNNFAPPMPMPPQVTDIVGSRFTRPY